MLKSVVLFLAACSLFIFTQVAVQTAPVIGTVRPEACFATGPRIFLDQKPSYAGSWKLN